MTAIDVEGVGYVANDSRVNLYFSRPGTATDSPFIEPVSGSLRDGCLKVNWFLGLEGAQEKIERWRQEYHQDSTQPPPGDITSGEYHRKYPNIEIF